MIPRYGTKGGLNWVDLWCAARFSQPALARLFATIQAISVTCLHLAVFPRKLAVGHALPYRENCFRRRRSGVVRGDRVPRWTCCNDARRR